MSGRLRLLLSRFGADERGATAIEYAILASMIAGVIVAGCLALGDSLSGVFNNIGNKLASI